MALDDHRMDSQDLSARDADRAAHEFDPGTKPTISTARLDTLLTQPTCVDPDAPIHRGAVPLSTAAPPSNVNHIALPLGFALHEYTIESVLGSGGFGITYLARDNNLQALVAIKEYLPNDLAVRSDGQTVIPKTESETHGYQVGLRGFLAESRVLASFRHPNIVRVIRFFEANNTAYMVMEYEKGLPLREWLKEHGPVGELRLLEMFLPLLEGLEVVHRSGVLHRDIKPANIYVRARDGSLVLLDFGSARNASSSTSRGLTSVVTPGYAPLEQYHAHGAQGPWSDLYAIGGVLYWVVTGDKPLEAPSRVKNDAMPSAFSRAGGRYSEDFLRAIDWALTPDEANRPKSVAELRAVLTGQMPAPRAAVSRPGANLLAAPAKPGVARNALAAAAIAAVAVVAVAALGYYFVGGERESARAAPQRVPRQPPPAGVAPSPPAAERPTPAAQAPRKAGAGRKTVKDKRGAEAPAPTDTAAKQTPEGPAAIAKDAAPVATPAPARQVAYLIFDVPAGTEIHVDGKKVGTAPLGKLKVSTGEHKVLVTGDQPPYAFHFWVDLAPNENKQIWAAYRKGDPF